MKRKALLRCLPARVPSSPRRITTALPLSPSATAFTVPAYPPDLPTSKPFTEAESVLPATSLLAETGEPVDRIELLIELLAALERRYDAWLATK